jgi:hypothetical protein
MKYFLTCEIFTAFWGFLFWQIIEYPSVNFIKFSCSNNQVENEWLSTAEGVNVILGDV